MVKRLEDDFDELLDKAINEDNKIKEFIIALGYL